MQVPAGLVLRGHFAFPAGSSPAASLPAGGSPGGRHGDTWLRLDLLLADAKALHVLAGRLAETLRPFDSDVVCGPLDGGAFVAQSVAARLGATFAYTSPDSHYGLSAAAIDLSGRRVVVVDDAINAGVAVTATAEVLRRAAAVVVAIGSVFVCQPAGGSVGHALGVPQEHLMSIETGLWPAVDCPLCAAGLDLDAT